MSQADSPTVPAPDAGTVTPRVVVFDFDGVLIHGDAFYLFMRERYRRSPLRWLIALLCLPVLLLLLPFSRRWPVRLLIFVALLGLRERSYRAAAEAFAGQLVRRPKQFCRDGLQVLRRHQAQGHRVIVVTGCEQHLVSAILQQLGMTDLEILASQLRQGWVSMRLLRHNVRRRKVQSLAEHGVTAWQFAYGDSMNDVAMMKVASEPVLVNGSPALCKKVEKALGRAVSRVEWI